MSVTKDRMCKLQCENCGEKEGPNIPQYILTLGLSSISAVAHTVGCRKGQGTVLLSVRYHLVKHRQ